jgi:lactate dehydrogenase-like 2-hydroxyacid dehydrogenase
MAPVAISVSEHVVMMILGLVRNYIPSYQWVVKGGWNIADCVTRSYDVEGMHVGTVAASRIGLAVLRRLNRSTCISIISTVIACRRRPAGYASNDQNQLYSLPTVLDFLAHRFGLFAAALLQCSIW